MAVMPHSVHQACEHGLDLGIAADEVEAGDRVDDHAPRLELIHPGVYRRQVGFQSIGGRPRGAELQQALAHPGFQVDADRAHVAHDLLGRLFEREIQAALAAPAGRASKVGRQAALSGAGLAGSQHRAVR